MKKMDAVALGIFLTHFSGQFHNDITVALQKLMRFLKYFRPFFLKPQQFRRYIRRQKIVAGHAEYLIGPDFFLYFFTKMPCPRIHPNRRIM